MTLVAGLASLDHPYARTDPTVAVLGRVVAVPQTPGHDPRLDRYRLAAHWCGAGPFLPLSWMLDLTMQQIGACMAEAADRFRNAVDAAAGRIEFAVRIERQTCGGMPAGGSGRDYLRSLKTGQEYLRTIVDDLLALAPEARFTISRASRREKEASCLIGCERDDAERVEHAVKTFCDRRVGLRMALAGPLPPFGAGSDAIARIGLAPLEPMA